jgi:regulator of RNase E activity RraB
MSLKEQLVEVAQLIEQLEEERRQIYEDSQVDANEHPRLAIINHELEHQWDLKRRIEAAINAGLASLPVPPPEHPEDMVG